MGLLLFNTLLMLPLVSRFSFYAYASGLGSLIAPFVVACFFIYTMLGNYMELFNTVPVMMVAFPLSIIGALVFWFVVIRKWLLQLEVSDYSIKTRDTFGKGSQKEWLYNELEGYSIKLRQMKSKGEVEQLTVWQKGKKAFVLIEPMFTNYAELKSAVIAKLKVITPA